MTSLNPALLSLTVHQNQSTEIPAHHVTQVVSTPNPGLVSYLSNWNKPSSQSATSKARSRSSSRERITKDRATKTDKAKVTSQRTAFQNPWPSWCKPTKKQVWDALEWGEDQDPCIELAISHLSKTDTASKGVSANTKGENVSRTQAAAQLLQVEKPDFDFDTSSGHAKTTWLGHAGILVQLPPLIPSGRPIRCIFDPIFSNRCSPSQVAGPLRSYPPPCQIESLPPIDVYLISHDHYDHLDYNTVVSIWKLNKDWIRFVVPLGNKPYFINCGINDERITELDWWESIDLCLPHSPSLKITCTPSQHNSGGGLSANQTLWSSWYLQHPQPKPYRVFFAGDTGFQFHASPGWPPEPTVTDGKVSLAKKEYHEKNPSPSCPAFQEIADRLGSPDLLLLPVAVGASFSYLRSYVPLPDSISPMPRHQPGVTGANHMPPWDAVRVLRTMTSDSVGGSGGQQPVAVAMHWGTFVPERTEVLKTLGQLEYACSQHDVRFGRLLEDVEGKSTQPVFLALNHGQSVVT